MISAPSLRFLRISICNWVVWIGSAKQSLLCSEDVLKDTNGSLYLMKIVGMKCKTDQTFSICSSVDLLSITKHQMYLSSLRTEDKLSRQQLRITYPEPSKLNNWSWLWSCSYILLCSLIWQEIRQRRWKIAMRPAWNTKTFLQRCDSIAYLLAPINICSAFMRPYGRAAKSSTAIKVMASTARHLLMQASMFNSSWLTL